MKHNAVLLLCAAAVMLGGCSSKKEQDSTTTQTTEITTSTSTNQLSETTSHSLEPIIDITNSKSTEPSAEVSSSQPTNQPSEIYSSKQTDPPSETSSLNQTNQYSETNNTLSENASTSEQILDDSIYIGEYLDSVIMEPNLEIAKDKNGKYLVQIGIYRLAFFNDGTGELTDDGISFTATDPSGNPIYGMITIEDQTAIVTFTKSTWEYISNGSVFLYTKASDSPTILSMEDGTSETSTDTAPLPSAYIGLWRLDGPKTAQMLQEGWTLQTMFGSGLQQFGASMEIKEDGSFSYSIGIGLGGTGQLTAEDNGFSVTITPYESHSDELEVQHLRAETDSDVFYLIMDNYMEGNDLYWVKQ